MSGFSSRQVFWLCLLIASPGCAQFNLFSGIEKLQTSHLVATPENPVIDSICLWETGSGTGLTGLPARGFVGQMMFFTKKMSQPVAIDGDVTIYVFDDQGTLEEQARPVHQFKFTSEEMQTFRTVSKVGIAYQMFIPYTRAGSHRAACSIRVRYVPNAENGMPVYSKFASILLVGTTPPKGAESIGKPGVPPSQEIQLASHQTAEAPSRQPFESPGISLEKLHAVPQPKAGIEDKLRLQQRLGELASANTSAPVAVENVVTAVHEVITTREEAPSARPAAPQPSSGHPLQLTPVRTKPAEPASTVAPLTLQPAAAPAPVAPVMTGADKHPLEL